MQYLTTEVLSVYYTFPSYLLPTITIKYKKSENMRLNNTGRSAVRNRTTDILIIRAPRKMLINIFPRV